MFSKKLMMVTVVVAAMFLGLGCSKEDAAALDSSLGSAKLAVLNEDGSMVKSVHWEITDASGAEVRDGDIDVSDPAATISTFISGLPVGTGYTMTLTAELLGADGTTVVGDCEQSATFDVVAGQVTSLTMTLNCTYDETEGDLILNAEANLCPTIDYLTVNPLSQALTKVIDLGAEASDGDGDAVTYAWSASPLVDPLVDGQGTMSNGNMADASFTCTQKGTVTLTLKVDEVDDGVQTADDDLPCDVQKSVVVTCTTPFECGNGVVETGETCDPTVGTQVSCDADNCSASCQSEGCGNGRTECTETCDPPDGIDCDATCHRMGCGNGVIDTARGETCDDSNTDPCDGCSASCHIEVCGNGVMECDEACDDGDPSDPTCSDTCTIPAEPCDGCMVTNCTSYLGKDPYPQCYAAANGDLCSAVMECARDTQCMYEDVNGNPWPEVDALPNKCYCGTASPLSCVGGSGNGECKAEMEAAAGTTNPELLAERFSDMGFAIGDAFTLMLCQKDYCKSLCL